MILYTTRTLNKAFLDYEILEFKEKSEGTNPIRRPKIDPRHAKREKTRRIETRTERTEEILTIFLIDFLIVAKDIFNKFTCHAMEYMKDKIIGG